MSGAPEVDDAPNRLPDPLSEDQLRRHFTLHDPDLEEVALCRGTVNKLGFAVQLCTLRWQGFFLRELDAVPGEVLDALAAQLGVLSIGLGAYPGEEKTRRIHLERIRAHLGFVRCGEGERARLLAFLGQEARNTPRTELLRKAAHAWLLNQKIVRPGRTTLRDLIAHAREAALGDSFTILTRDLTAEQGAQLDALLAAAREEPESSPWPRSPLEGFKQLPKKESAETILFLLTRLRTVLEMGFAVWPGLDHLHPNLRRHLALWGYRYDAYNLRRFAEPKRRAVLLCFLSLVVAETADGVVEALDKVMNDIHAKARKRRQELLRASEEARRRAVEVVETLGTLALSEEVPDGELRRAIFERFPPEDLGRLVEGSRLIREGDDGSHHAFTARSWEFTRRFSPTLLAVLPLAWSETTRLGEAITFMREFNAAGKRKFGADVPLGWLPPKWQGCVVRRVGREVEVSRSHYEMALLSTLVEKLKSGDVTVRHSRRWADFEQYLIPQEDWQRDRERHYETLGLPLDAGTYLNALDTRLHAVTQDVNTRVPKNEALTLDREKGTWRLAPTRANTAQINAKAAKALIENAMPTRELLDIVIELDSRLDILGHFLHGGEGSRLPRNVRRRNVLAALIAVGCNIGTARMAAASGLSSREISLAADWYLTEDALRAASVDLVNFASKLPMAAIYGLGDTCSADGMRFYVPVNILAADYSHLLGARGVNMYAHTTDTSLRLYQQSIPVRLREATFVLDGLLEHGTELDPKRVVTDSHGFSEVVMASASLLDKELAPRIARVHEQTLYKLDRGKVYAHLDPILKGTLKPHVVREAWDDVVRVMASIKTGTGTASLILHRLGSYARQNRIHQALAEIGRAEKTMHILRTVDSEAYRRAQTRELNKGEAANDLSRFLFFGQEGALRGREFGDRAQSFSALAVLHNAVVAWNILTVEGVVARLRSEGHE
ncbi:Tn3 family transposase [Deinococcus ficus]|uniref:Tn3 family transposase n=1 Tax=Deinococcus ficus TaxID=317577 RepID=UPI0003B6D204|nr:Tn3 family transposase [Deinococcus ficus]